jgi:predicted aspartyl protease
MTLKIKPQGELKMGLTHVEVRIKNYRSEASFTEKFLVDTGAWDSMASASKLKSIGIEPVGKKTYELANGELHEYEFGYAEFFFMDDTTIGQIIFGPENIEPILGVFSLESAGYIVDLVKQTIKKFSAFPLKHVA